jgi:hypothetical protein
MGSLFSGGIGIRKIRVESWANRQGFLFLAVQFQTTLPCLFHEQGNPFPVNPDGIYTISIGQDSA